MRRDKALLHVAGVPLWQRQQELLAASGAGELFLSARPEQAWAAKTSGFAAVLHDAFPDCGPIGGICAALERMGGSHLLVLAVDLPRLPAPWFARLLAECGDEIGCVGARGGFFEPLAAVYPRALQSLVWDRLARGEYSLQTLLSAAVETRLMRTHAIAADEAPWFDNWNEPDETYA